MQEPWGEWFLGDWGDEYWDHHVIDWTRIDGDGTWTYGVHGCNGEPMFFGGTWRELEPGVVEFTADNEIDILPFNGYIGATAQIESKRAAARPRDLADVSMLEKIRERG